MGLTEEQRQQIEANRQAALAKRKAFLESQQQQQQQLLFKCQKLSHSRYSSSTSKPALIPKFVARLEICSPDSFSVVPIPSDDDTFSALNGLLSDLLPSHFTQISTAVADASVYHLSDYLRVLNCLKAASHQIADVEDIPWNTLKAVETMMLASGGGGTWTPTRPEHLTDEQVEDLIAKLPRSLVDALMPFQLDGIRFGLRRGGRCLIADDMGLGKTLQTQAVLDVATKVKHIVLLSGTPSLSRPFDIFHQINMLWHGLLGTNKREFAKTYCDMKFFMGIQGKVFADYSKGIRLVELNVLLKQTVMIRRLKEHVMLQLPPKRRQIIRLLLKKSDIVAAKTAVGALTIDDPERASEDMPLGNSDEVDGDLSVQELGIAKLSGFREWLSLHPLIAGSENSKKMIIFAHHHKVLDGVQEFICEKGVGFVRIDGSTLPRDRQSAVVAFRSSSEVKIAIIGILAAGFGLDFSTAQDVVFLELPQCPTVMLQAEDRAHRRGQKNAVNVYIFCAKDTSDELRWKNLNKSLHRVSKTTDGKYDAMKEIVVDDISYLETYFKTDSSEEQSAREKALVETLLDKKPSPVNLSESEVKQDDKSDEQASFDNNSISTANITVQDKKSIPTVEADDMQPDHQLETDGHGSSHVGSLRFEVSPYTGRIHLYSCVLGTDARPQPLYENFRPEELELLCPVSDDEKKKIEVKSVKENPVYRHSLMEFAHEWRSLRPIERKKLLGKPLQLPLAVELCYLSESNNHNNKGLLNGGSKRRMTPLVEVCHPLPEDAVWKKVYLRSGLGKKEKEYTQGWSVTDEPLCKLCQKQCMGKNAKAPEFFEDLFCNLACYEEYRMRTSNRFLRQELFQIEHGVCTNCLLDCHKLVEHIKPLSLERRREYIEKVAPKVAKRKKMLEKLVNDPTEGNAWHADHIIPVYQGGGECKLENMRTLCVACHYDVTKEQCDERRKARANARKHLKFVMNNLKNGLTGTTVSNAKEHEAQEGDKLFINVPGSAYSLADPSESGKH
nr:DNA annealing helicase and endonuclease ZRANB3 isoform X2 [Arachis hypogaea]